VPLRMGRWTSASRAAGVAEALLEGLVGGGRAQPGVAVHVRGADPGHPDHTLGVVLLQEQLPGGVEGHRQRPLGGQQLPGPLDDRPQGSVPVSLDQLPVPADQGADEPVGGVVGLPPVQPLGAQPAAVDPVLGPAPYPDDPVVLDGDVHPAPVRAEHTRRLDPPVDVLLAESLLELEVDPDRPRGPLTDHGTLAPRCSHPVHRHVRPPLAAASCRHGNSLASPEETQAEAPEHRCPTTLSGGESSGFQLAAHSQAHETGREDAPR
jgi:hypothetical protein